ncbi:hypothetical protein JHK87_018702 [Glycine soja]|nr:hypothetical protein JHK87_018702 [Glycine soja]
MPGILSRLNATIYCRIREAITRQQGVPTSLYRSSALPLCSLTSSHTLHTKSMITASHSNAMLGDVYAYGLISGRGSVRDFTKPAEDPGFEFAAWIMAQEFLSLFFCLLLAGAAHAVSFDGSPPDEQLANSSFSPDPYVIVVLNILNSISP